MSTSPATLSLFEFPPVDRDGIYRDALFSPCGLFRYTLSRHWKDKDPGCSLRKGYKWGLVCGINPSTADHKTDDPTVQSLIRRARIWGWGGFEIVNLCGFISSSPSGLPGGDVRFFRKRPAAHAPTSARARTALATPGDPIGPDNEQHVERLARLANESGGALVAMWGRGLPDRPELQNLDSKILGLLTSIGDVFCLGLNQDGSPRHALARGEHRIPDETPLSLFRAKASP